MLDYILYRILFFLFFSYFLVRNINLIDFRILFHQEKQNPWLFFFLSSIICAVVKEIFYEWYTNLNFHVSLDFFLKFMCIYGFGAIKFVFISENFNNESEYFYTHISLKNKQYWKKCIHDEMCCILNKYDFYFRISLKFLIP